jgi:predicted negative regulator of RcsB-dependent stress response
MTATQPDTTAADRAQTFIDWTKINARALGVGAAIVLVAAAGYWFYARSKEIQSANAEKALMQAKQSMSAGNLALAQSDLQKVFSRWESTPAGVEAAMLLAQIDFDAGKYQDGLTKLQKVAGTGAAAPSQSTIESLEGDGLAQMGKLADAAKAYQRAADATNYEIERAFQRAKAARAFQAAGDAASARAIWTQLATDPTAQTMAAEARVRLGELDAQSAKR